MIIGIDIDDTISDTAEVLFNCAQKYIVEDLEREPIVFSGPFTNHLFIQQMHGLVDEEDKSFLDKYYEFFVENVIPKTFAVEYIKRLKDEGNKIVLITARFETDNFDVKDATIRWLKKYNVPYDKLIMNAATKLEAAKNENVDIFIDDSYKNCKELSNNNIKAFLMDSIANKGLEIEGVDRVYSWPHIYYKIKNDGGNV